jgi:hypothetical protein
MIAVSAVIALSMFGCGGGSGPRLYSVSGVLKVNGNPLPDVRVQLFPIETQNKAGIIAWGVTDSNGKYAVKSPDGYGAAAGSYKVVLSSESSRPTSEADAAAKSKDREEMSKRIREAAKKMSNRGRAAGPDQGKIEAMKRAMSNPGGADPAQLEALKRSMGPSGNQSPMDRAVNGPSLPFPDEYCSVATTPKEVEVKDRAVTLDLEL